MHPSIHILSSSSLSLSSPTSLLEGIEPSLYDGPQVVGIGEGQEGIHGAEGVPEAVVCHQWAGKGPSVRIVGTAVHHLI